MRRSAGFRDRPIPALPPPAMAPPGEAEDCRAWAEGGVHVDPILLSGVERGRRVHVEIDATVAEEIVQIAERGWLLSAMLRLPDEGLAFPAGTVLVPNFAGHQPLCLPLAPPAGAEPPGGATTAGAGSPA